jgi:anti-anti-sigma factor
MSTTQRHQIEVTATFVANLVASVHIGGDVDAAAEDDLARVMTHLYMRRCRTVYIDLGDVTFADRTLSAFIAAVYLIDDKRTSVILCRPSATTRRLIERAGLHAIVTIRDELSDECNQPDPDSPAAPTGRQIPTARSQPKEPAEANASFVADSLNRVGIPRNLDRQHPTVLAGDRSALSRRNGRTIWIVAQDLGGG